LSCFLREEEGIWREVMDRSIRRLAGGHTDPLLFLEAREDVRIDRSTGCDPLELHTAARGVSLEAGDDPERFHHLADPAPEDIEPLADNFVCDRAPTGRLNARERPRGEPVLKLDRGRMAMDAIFNAVPDVSSDVNAYLTGRYVEFRQEVVIARPNRQVATDLRQGARIRLEAYLERGGSTGSATVEWTDRPGRAIEPEKLVRTAFNRAAVRLEAQPAPSGQVQAVFAPGVGGILIHELVGHALEGDTVARGGSMLAREGMSFSSTRVTVIDDPRRGRAPWRLDDEGEEPRPVPLVRAGRIAGKLHDRKTARVWSERPTGHGRRSSYLEPVRPRMGCTFLAAGRIDPAEVVEGTREGVYIRRMEAAAVDPASGVALFRVYDADRIHEGKIDHPLSVFLMRADLKTTLVSLDLIASDLVFDSCVGSCLRDGQPVAVSVGTPTFRVGSVRVLKENLLN